MDSSRIPNLASLFRAKFKLEEAGVRGGGFLDNLEVVHPVLKVSMLEDGMRTRHSDLGFRVTALVPISMIPRKMRALLETLPSLPEEIRESLLNENRYDLKYAFPEDDNDL